MSARDLSASSVCTLGHCRHRDAQLGTRAGAYSHIGRRPANDDAVFAGDHCRFFVVLDGIGGHAGGGEASRILLERLRSRVEPACLHAGRDANDELEAGVRGALAEAVCEMTQLAGEVPEFHRMGTVFALAYVVNDSLLFGRVGDCRVYLQSAGRMRQLTDDETYVQLMVDMGVVDPEEARQHPLRNVVLNSVGAEAEEHPPTIESRPLRIGDCVLLTSDGVSDKLTSDELNQLLNEHPDPDEAARAIVHAALEAGGSDNASCVVVRIDPPAGSAGRLALVRRQLGRLEQLVEQLGPEAEDDAGRRQLAALTQQIRNELELLERGASAEPAVPAVPAVPANDESAPATLAEHLHRQATEWEAGHPRLTNAIGALANMLSNLGI